MGLEMDNEKRYEKLKRELFLQGYDAIEEFLGYSDRVAGLSKNGIENLIDQTYAQMPDDVLAEFYEKYNIE